MKHPNKDFVAEAIADFEAMNADERGQLLLQIMEDQPILMGFVTNLADDFSDNAHAALVDAVVILINAFVSAGIPVNLIPQAMMEEVINERVDAYEARAGQIVSDDVARQTTDSPLVFADLRNHALFHSNIAKEAAADRQRFSLVLDTLVAIIERSAAVEITSENKGHER